MSSTGRLVVDDHAARELLHVLAGAHARLNAREHIARSSKEELCHIPMVESVCIGDVPLFA